MIYYIYALKLLKYLVNLPERTVSPRHLTGPQVYRTESAWAGVVDSLDSLPPPCPVNCSLTCTLTYQPQVCTALALPGCKEDGDVVFSISSNLSQHDTQPEPGVLYLPVDRVEAAGKRTEAPLVCPHRTSLDCQASCHQEAVATFVRRDSVFSHPAFWGFLLLRNRAAEPLAERD